MKRLFILIFAIGCGLAASQFPEFAQQYRQRLGGAVDELARMVTKFDKDAADAGLTREAALNRYENSGDEFLGRRGETIKTTLSRYERLKTHATHLNEAGKFKRLVVFVKERDTELSKATLDAFEPAVPTTTEGAAHAAGGFAGGWILLTTILMPIRRRRRVANA